jgi:hypothetical protein
VTSTFAGELPESGGLCDIFASKATNEKSAAWKGQAKIKVNSGSIGINHSNGGTAGNKIITG